MSDLSGEMLFGIISMALALVLWVRVLMNKRHSDDWLEDRLLERQERLDSQGRMANRPAAPKPEEPSPTGTKKGPWG